MKVIDLAQKKNKAEKAGAIDDMMNRLNQTLGGKEGRAYDLVALKFSQVLDHHYTLIKNIPLASPGEPNPLVLMGPAGVYLIYPSLVRGIFRVRENQWEMMESGGGGSYRSVKPNLVEKVLAARDKLIELLSGLDPLLQNVEAALVFTDPGAHIETERPVIRVVPQDALDRFIAGLIRSPLIINDGLVKEAVARLTQPPDDEERLRDVAFGDLEGRPIEEQADSEPSRLSQLTSEEPAVIQKMGRHVNFSRRQWIILGVLLVGNFCILIIGIILATILM